MLVEHRAIAEDVRSRNADEASLDEHVKAMTGGGPHPVINWPVLIPDFRDGEALDLGANRRMSAKGREAGRQGSTRERTGVRPSETSLFEPPRTAVDPLLTFDP
jgi:hypothetical protein